METNVSEQTLVLKNRRELTLNGVEYVVGFDPEYVALETVYGKLTVEGRELIIDDLSKKDGRISVIGEISAFYFSDKPAKRSGLLSILKK